jgi:hypothetical protein
MPQVQAYLADVQSVKLHVGRTAKDDGNLGKVRALNARVTSVAQLTCHALLATPGYLNRSQVATSAAQSIGYCFRCVAPSIPQTKRVKLYTYGNPDCSIGNCSIGVNRTRR